MNVCGSSVHSALSRWAGWREARPDTLITIETVHHIKHTMRHTLSMRTLNKAFSLLYMIPIECLVCAGGWLCHGVQFASCYTIIGQVQQSPSHIQMAASIQTLPQVNDKWNAPLVSTYIQCGSSSNRMEWPFNNIETCWPQEDMSNYSTLNLFEGSHIEQYYSPYMVVVYRTSQLTQ